MSKKIISIRRSKSTEIAKSKSKKLIKKYGLKLFDEFIFASMHLLLVEVDDKKIKDIKSEAFVIYVENPPELSFQ